MREDVRIRDIMLEVSPEGRRVAVDLELTPFIERPSIQIAIVNGNGEPAGSSTIIETLDHKFGLVVHLRDREPTEEYQVTVMAYYTSLEEGARQVVHQLTKGFTVNRED